MASLVSRVNSPKLVIRDLFGREPDDIKVIKDDQTRWHNNERLKRFSTIAVVLVDLFMLARPL